MNRSGRNILSLNTLMRADDSSERSDARRHGRVRIELMSCSLGTVLDLSRSGMRVLARRRRELVANMKHQIVLEAFDQRVELPCRIAWIEKRGLFKSEIGIEFGELTDDQAAVLCSIARTAASNAQLGSFSTRRAS
ncbi:MAG: PilZ domain-containing protein [Phycisphaerales bacterium]